LCSRTSADFTKRPLMSSSVAAYFASRCSAKAHNHSGSRWPCFANSIVSLATSCVAGSLRSTKPPIGRVERRLRRACGWRCSRPHLQGQRSARRKPVDVVIGVRAPRGSKPNTRLCRESRGRHSPRAGGENEPEHCPLSARVSKKEPHARRGAPGIENVGGCPLPPVPIGRG
jgi:hypothetical protein